MGLFQHKQSKRKSEEGAEELDNFFDEYFREELRNRGRWYFEKVISENGALFKQDLDSTVQELNANLKQHIAEKLDTAITEINAELKENLTKHIEEQFAKHTQTMQQAQDVALKSLTESAQSLQDQHKKLTTSLEEDVAEQKSMLHRSFEENKARLADMNNAQASAMEWLKNSAQSLQDHYNKMGEMLDNNVAQQEAALVKSFEDNMAHVIERYLHETLGEQYDLKAQLPSIIEQMEARKQEIVDDIKL